MAQRAWLWVLGSVAMMGCAGLPPAPRHPLDDKAFAIDHFEAKLFRLAKDFRTAAGRRLAVERQERLRGVLAMMLDEI